MNTSWWSKRPAARVVLLFTAGIVLDNIVRIAPSLLFFLVAGSLLIVGFAHFQWRSSVLTSIGLHLVLILLGLLSVATRRDQIENDILNPKYYGERVLVEGRVESEPVRRGSRSEMIVRTALIGNDSADVRVERRVLIHIVRTAHWEDSDSLEIGDIVRISGHLESLPGARNPGDFDYGRYLVLNGIQGFVSVRDTNSVHRTSRSKSFTLSDFIGRAQNSIYRIFDRYHGPGEASFLKGVVFGYRGDLSAEVKQAFMDTGTIHILAVSGSNVVVVALIFYSLVGFLRISPRAATACTLIGLLWYMVITGLSPSVIRATIMASSILIGTVIGRKGDIYNSLSFAALLMLAWDPTYLLDVGFQLSFAAVISIVYFYPKLELLTKLLPDRLTRFTIVESTLKLFAVSVAAQLGTLPFSAYYFGRVSLISVLANLLVVPLSGLNTLLGITTVGCSFISGWAASCYAALNDLLVSFLLRFVMWSSTVPHAYVETLGAGALFTVVYYVAIAALFNAQKPRVLVRAVLCCLIAMNVLIYGDVLQYGAPSLTVTAIDVGQGDALLVEFPNKRRVLLDAGPKSLTGDAGQRVIAPYLKRRGIETLDAVILSHAHDDHIGGCRFLLEAFDVRRLIVADTTAVTKLYGELLEAVRQRRVPIQIARAGERLQFDPQTRIFVLHPGSRLSEGDLNNRSLVLKVSYGATSLLLPGDASQDVEDRLVHTRSQILASDVLKVAHHGSPTSSSESFLESVRPSLAVISVGRLNKFNHPSPVVLSRYRHLGIATTRTDLDGAVVLNSDGMRFRIVPWRRSGIL